MPNAGDWLVLASAFSRALGSVAYEKVGIQEGSSGQSKTVEEDLVNLALRWARFQMTLDVLEERASPGSPFDDWRSANEVRQVARKAREEALQSPVQLPAFNADLGIYKPIFECFVELSSTEVEIYDAVLRACDARASGERERSASAANEEENAFFAVQYIQSLGEESWKSLPDRTSEPSETRLSPGDFWWPASATVFWLVLVLTEGWPLNILSWVPDVITDTSPIWYGVIALGSWLMTIHKVAKRLCEVASRG